MWSDFSDVELVQLAKDYGIEEEAVVIGGRLFNREEIEDSLTKLEYDLAFDRP